MPNTHRIPWRKNMKTNDRYRNEPNSTESKRDGFFHYASDRRPSTVVGFKADATMAPWSKWANRFVIAAIIQGALAAAVTSLFYQHLESNLRAPYTGISNVFAWLHLVLMNVGVTGATWLMWIGGWRAVNFISTMGASAFCTATATKNDPSCSVHVQVLGPLVTPIAIFAVIALLGAFAGGIGYLMAWRRSMRSMKASA